MKTILTLTAVAALSAGAGYAQTVVTEGAPVVVTTPSTTVQSTQTDPATTGSGAAGGAASGAIAGAIVGGPVGAAVGGLAGAVMGDVTEDALTPATRTYVLENKTESVMVEGGATVGTVLPETVQVQTIPDSQYSYVYVDDQPVLVEPQTRKIVYVIK